MPRSVDYLIIGQGLAGSLLAWELMQRGFTVHIVDNQKENASQVAAGLINPVTGMRLVKSNDVDTLLPCAKQQYQSLSQFFKTDFYTEKTLLRVVRSEKELLQFNKRLQQPAYADFLLPNLQPSPKVLNAPLGLIQQKQTGYLSTAHLLSQLKNFFQAKQCYQATQFDYQELTFSESITWQNTRAKNIIFCEGYQAINNPWFKHLPFQLAKGEILSFKTEIKLIPQMLNYGNWFIPLSDNQFRIGATFENKQLDTQTTDIAKQTLFDTFKKIYPSLHSVQLTQHQANIRPTTLDKHAFIGQHQQHKNMYIFNGFGAKGSLQIPFYSQHFIDYLQNNRPLNASVDINRFI